MTITGGCEPGREVRAKRSPDAGGTMAVLDLGTNNCRLLVARPAGRDFRVIDAFSRAVRLGEGVGGSNRLSEAGQMRALKALRICAGKIRYHRPRHVRVIATEACRRAENGPDFIARAAELTGLHLDIISAEEEARLAVAGCAPLIVPQAEQVLVFDIGGGSTELIWLDLSHVPPADRSSVVRDLTPPGGLPAAAQTRCPARVTDWISVPMGVSTLSDQFAEITPERARHAAMAAAFEEQLGPFAPVDAGERAAVIDRLQIVGVSGTATTFGALHLGLDSYDRSLVDGLWLPRYRVSSISDALLDRTQPRRTDKPGFGRGRAELLVAGAAIMETILRIWPVHAMRIADRGLREGMLYGLMRRPGS